MESKYICNVCSSKKVEERHMNSKLVLKCLDCKVKEIVFSEPKRFMEIEETKSTGIKYISKYDTVFECKHCQAKNKMPCNFCKKCGKKLMEGICLHCWRSPKKVIKNDAKSCNECNIFLHAPAGRYK